MRWLAGFFRRLHYRVAIMDPRGHGGSGGAFAFNTAEHEDVAAVIRDIVSSIGASSVILVGLSAGGAIAVTTAARHELPISALVLISAVGDFKRVTPALNPLTMRHHLDPALALTPPRFRWVRGRADRIRATEEIPRVHAPVCLIHVKNDWLVPHENSAALFEAANEPKELHLLDIEGHYHADRIFFVAEEQVCGIVTSFLEKYVRKQTEPRDARLDE
jgi:alpha-beta hydrolase superfamily lysophospholipase